MTVKPNAIESETFNHFRQEEKRRQDAILLLKKDGYIVYKRSTKSPRIYDTLGISKLIVKVSDKVTKNL
jgi:hypothetical protein